MNKEQLYIAFNCDIWRSSGSMRWIGVFDEKHLLAYFRKHYRDFEKNDGDNPDFTHKEAYAITVQDLLGQNVNCIYVETVTVNEER